jgi:hypothetical protein
MQALTLPRLNPLFRVSIIAKQGDLDLTIKVSKAITITFPPRRLTNNLIVTIQGSSWGHGAAATAGLGVLVTLATLNGGHPAFRSYKTSLSPLLNKRSVHTLQHLFLFACECNKPVHLTLTSLWHLYCRASLITCFLINLPPISIPLPLYLLLLFICQH